MAAGGMEMDWEREFKGYETELEPNKRERAYSWMTAIGLQDVDGLKTSVSSGLLHLSGLRD